MANNNWCECREYLIGTQHKCRVRMERQLVAAQEPLSMLGKKLHCLYLEVTPSIADDIMASYKELFAALTEAGEGEKK